MLEIPSNITAVTWGPKARKNLTGEHAKTCVGLFGTGLKTPLEQPKIYF